MAKLRLHLFSARGRQSFNAQQIGNLEAAYDVHFFKVLALLSDQQLLNLCQEADVIGLTRRACKDFHADIIDSLPKLKALAVYSSGFEWVDTEALTRKDIIFSPIVDYCSQTVAEHSIGMMFTFARRLHLSDRIARGELPLSVSLRGTNLQGKCLGIIGLGNIGAKVASIAECLGMTVSYTDISHKQTSYERVSLEAILPRSDYVVVMADTKRGHAPLLQLKHLELIKPGSFLINAARPALVESGLVLLAIQQKRLAGYAVDDKVFSQEDMQNIEPGRILQSCHTAWYSDESIEKGTATWVDNLLNIAKQWTDLKPSKKFAC